MPIHVEIPDEIAQWLEEKAKASDSKPEVVAVDTLRQQVEADAVELFESEKHALRRERHQVSF